MTQAERIIARFKGVTPLASLTGINRSTIYRWTYAKVRGGSGGVVPTKALSVVKYAASRHGIKLTTEDLAQNG